MQTGIEPWSPGPMANTLLQYKTLNFIFHSYTLRFLTHKHTYIQYWPLKYLDLNVTFILHLFPWSESDETFCQDIYWRKIEWIYLDS